MVLALATLNSWARFYQEPGWLYPANKSREGRMALILKGGEFIATEALSANILSGLIGLARCRPLLINGVELHSQDLVRLAEEAQRTGLPIWPRASTHETP